MIIPSTFVYVSLVEIDNRKLGGNILSCFLRHRHFLHRRNKLIFMRFRSGFLKIEMQLYSVTTTILQMFEPHQGATTIIRDSGAASEISLRTLTISLRKYPHLCDMITSQIDFTILSSPGDCFHGTMIANLTTRKSDGSNTSRYASKGDMLIMMIA